MSDDRSNPGPEDGKTIALNDPSEVRYACDSMGVTEERLREAVAAVGHSRKAVKAWLADHPASE